MSEDYRKGSHTIFSLQLHIIWITKYRYKVLKGEIADRTRQLVRRICAEERAEILSGVVSPDHIHILVSIDPSISVSTLVKYLKGKTSHTLQMEFHSLKKRYWGQHLWARGYFAVSVGNVTDAVVKQYIEHHFEGEGAEDPFRITDP
ncbi:IS200/IS605 family transposase [Patescibacteria group bacterium]|nr:IS200/IS605 family transposase [Patescibacteria group bacterium]